VSAAEAHTGPTTFRRVDVAPIRVLLLDADGSLFPSEEPAFAASATVLDRLMEELGSDARHDPQALRRATTGRNFRATAGELARGAGRPLAPSELDDWVAQENAVVTRHLAATLTPDPDVVGTLTRLGERFDLAVVSSSARSRLDACFAATGLADLLAPDRRFSAEDSLAVPTSKPDPAIYAHAGAALGIGPGEGLAVEDSLPGAQSAIAAGFATVGNVRFVAPDEREQRVAELREAGAHAVIAAWSELEELLSRDDGAAAG
jgi:HAD superfamily hydrolase (TIGR01509 family)